MNEDSLKSKKKQSALNHLMLLKLSNIAPMDSKITMKHVRNECRAEDATQDKRIKLAMSKFEKEHKVANSYLKTSMSRIF